jgi:transposase
LVYQLCKYPHLVVFPIHPNTAAQFRRSLYPSGAKSDPIDAVVLLELLAHHRDRLRRLKLDTAETRELQILVEFRRTLVADKTRCNNRLTAILKSCYPQALEWIDDIDSPMGCDFLKRWPTLQALQSTMPNKIRRFFVDHNCRSEQRIQQRLEAILAAVPAVTDTAILSAEQTVILVLVQEIQAIQQGILDLDEKIQAITARHPDRFIFDSLPGAGKVLVPRLIAVFGTDRDRFQRAAEVQNYTGISPVTEMSGRTRIVHMRRACPLFVRQTMFEFAAQSTHHCEWAKAYIDYQMKVNKKSWAAAIRGLAYKWIRIIFVCWRDRKPYDEDLFLRSLARHHSPLIHALPTTTPAKQNSTGRCRKPRANNATDPSSEPSTKIRWQSVAGFQKLTAEKS